MKKRQLLLIILTLCFSSSLLAQNASVDAIKSEGRDLYNLQLMVWNSSDYLYEHSRMGGLRGYVAYKSGDKYKCIYWTGAYQNLKIVFTFSSDAPKDIETMVLGEEHRTMTSRERMFYNVKLQAMLEIKGAPDFFKAPPEASLAVHFLETDQGIKAWVFPETHKDNVIPIGNDYVLIFSKTAQLLKKFKIRNTYTELPNNLPADDEGLVKTVHTNIINEPPSIQPSDICNLLLYSDHSLKQEHHVHSPRYISIYKVRENELNILPK